MDSDEIAMIEACLDDGTYTEQERRDFGAICAMARAYASILAAGDSDEIVRELRQWGPLSAVGRHEIPEIIERAASHILALHAELASVKAHAESSGDEVVRELHALRESAKPFPSGAGGQQCGMESYRIVASGNQLEVIYTAAARIVALEYHADELAKAAEWMRPNIESRNPYRNNSKAWRNHNDAFSEQVDLVDKAIADYRKEFPLVVVATIAAHPKDAP